MNDMTPIGETRPRHRQASITIRSDEAARLLAQLTSDGRSQAKVIEDALAREMAAKPKLTKEEFIAKIDAIVRPNHGKPGQTYRELREEFYDEFGLPR